MSTAPSPADDPAAFVAKWRGAWPEWAMAEGFVPAASRATANAWHALQFELQEAAWRGDDARPGEAKLGWWAEELLGWSQGRRRHPLGATLSGRDASWRPLAAALPALSASRARPRTADAACDVMAPVAAAVATVERELLGGATDAAAVAAAWQHARLARHPASAVPEAFADDAAGWSRHLLAGWPDARGAAPSRRIELALAQARLRRGDAAMPLPPWAALWAGWRAARG